MHSPWVSRLLSEVGHEVIVAHARNVRLIGEESQEGSSLGCAESGSAGAYRSRVAVSSETSQRESASGSDGIRARAGLVRARTALVNMARGRAKSYGERLRGCNVCNMNPEKAEELSPELQAALQPFLAAVESLSERID